MPWKIQTRGGKFCVIKESDGSTEKCHDSKAKALAHMRALYASEGKSMDNDAMIYFGGEVKALNDSGLVGGYLIRFTDAKRKDLHDEFFTSKTYLGPREGDGAESLFDHGFPVPMPDGVDAETKRILAGVAEHTFAPLKTKRDAMGIWAEVVLDLADEYEKCVYGIAKKNKLGWSSGAPVHRVRKNANGEITSWPIAEGSLTPTPAEPLNRAISMKAFGSVKFVSLEDDNAPDDVEDKLPAGKSLAARLTRFIEDSVDDGHPREDVVKRLAREALMDTSEVERVLNGEVSLRGTAHLKAFARVLEVPYETLKSLADNSEPRTIKGMFEDELAGRVPGIWDLQSTLSCVARKIAEAAKANAEVGSEYDWRTQTKEAAGEFSARVGTTLDSQIEMYVSGEDSDDEFYLKNGFISSGSLVTEGLDFDEHSELVVTAFREIVKRFRDNHEMRKSTKAGRVLSDKNRQRLVKMLDAIQTAVTDCHSLLEETKPMANATEKRAAYIDHLRTETELLRQSIGV